MNEWASLLARLLQAGSGLVPPDVALMQMAVGMAGKAKGSSLGSREPFAAAPEATATDSPHLLRWSAVAAAVAGYMQGSRHFEIGGDEVNVGRLRCNVVALLRRTSIELANGGLGPAPAGSSTELLDPGAKQLLEAGAALAAETAERMETRAASLSSKSKEHRGQRMVGASTGKFRAGELEPRVRAARAAAQDARREQGAMQVAIGALIARGLARLRFSAATGGNEGDGGESTAMETVSKVAAVTALAESGATQASRALAAAEAVYGACGTGWSDQSQAIAARF